MAFRHQVADAILAGWREDAELPLTMRAGSFTTELRLQPVSREDIRESAAHAVARAADEGAARVARICEREMLEKYDGLRFSEPIRVSWILLGGRLILALPFEGFTATGEIIREKTGMESAMILGCADELLGYLPSLQDIRQGGYAALESTYLYKRLPILPGEAERIGEAVAAEIRAIRQETAD